MLIKGLNQAASPQATAELLLWHSRMWPRISVHIRKYPIGLIKGLMEGWHPDPSTPGQGDNIFLCEGSFGIYDIIKQGFLKKLVTAESQ